MRTMAKWRRAASEGDSIAIRTCKIVQLKRTKKERTPTIRARRTRVLKRAEEKSFMVQVCVFEDVKLVVLDEL